LNQKFTINSLANYGSLTKDKINEHRTQLEFYAQDIVRKARYFEFLYTIEKQYEISRTYNSKGCSGFNLEFINLNKYLLDNNLNVKSEYLDVSEFNMHIRWEPVIPLLIKELSAIGVPISSADIVEDILKKESEYIKRKTQKLITNQDYYAQMN